MYSNGGTTELWIEQGYPRPQLRRDGWVSLNGAWEFQMDPRDEGLQRQWYLPFRQEESRRSVRGEVATVPQSSTLFDTSITVPFPPGSELSGVCVDAPDDVPDVVWYRRQISPEELATLGAERAATNGQVFLNFEAVDYQADVWVDGQHCARHVGGYTPFSVPMGTDLSSPKTVVVRAQDSRDPEQPRGKQAWRDQPDGIWYHRSTGIWRDVWMEARPRCSVTGFNWETDLTRGVLMGAIALSAPTPPGATIQVALRRGDQVVASLGRILAERTTEALVQLPIPELRNRMDWDQWLWSPDRPNLLDLSVELKSGGERDCVSSYVGLRTVDVTERYVRVNGNPVYIRGVLDQGYWPQSFFTAPTVDDLKGEVELVLSLGFNLSRIHERTPDRRYLYWADRLGLMVWGESASTYAFGEAAMRAVIDEWYDIVIRDRAAPSIITWVPFNESWGVGQIAHSPRQRAFVESVVALTRALDGTRPVSANDGWEQLDTDVVTTHDYGTSGEQLFVNYRDAQAVADTLDGEGPQGRRTLLGAPWTGDKPVIVSEFGGVSLENDQGGAEESGWGYDQVSSAAEFQERFDSLVTGLLRSPILAGFCYTQLTDTLQEVNGICTADRQPKIPAETVRRIVQNSEPAKAQQRPRLITDKATKEATP